MNRPNILFIMSDEQRFDCIGYENYVVKTPHLDQLGKDGIIFKKAYTTNPSCVPARAAIFTGKIPSKCLCPTFITYLPNTEITFQKILRDNGYYTAVVGKQHFGESSIDKGYDYEEIIDAHMPIREIEEASLKDPYNCFLKEKGFKLNTELTNWDTSFSWHWHADPCFHIDDYVGERGLSWLENEAPADKPWYLNLSFPGPHMPYDGNGLPEEGLYSEEAIDLPKSKAEDLDSKPPHFKCQYGHGNPAREGAEHFTEADIRRTRKAYYANQSLIDNKAGQIIDYLKESGLYDNTLIIYSTDHGDFMGDFGLLGKGEYLSEVLMRVPLIVKPPEVHWDRRRHAVNEVNDFITTIDIPATCLSAADIDVPESMDGKDLNGYWNSRKSLCVQETAYFEAQHLRGLRYEDWKLVYYHEREYGELYDLDEDPWERNNLWDQSGHQEMKGRLIHKLLDRILSFEPRSGVEWNHNAPVV